MLKAIFFTLLCWFVPFFFKLLKMCLVSMLGFLSICTVMQKGLSSQKFWTTIGFLSLRNTLNNRSKSFMVESFRGKSVWYWLYRLNVSICQCYSETNAIHFIINTKNILQCYAIINTCLSTNKHMQSINESLTLSMSTDVVSIYTHISIDDISTTHEYVSLPFRSLWTRICVIILFRCFDTTDNRQQFGISPKLEMCYGF